MKLLRLIEFLRNHLKAVVAGSVAALVLLVLALPSTRRHFRKA